MNNGGQQPTNKMLRREAAEVLDPKSPTYTAVVRKLSARDTSQMTKKARDYWKQLLAALFEALEYGWYFGVNKPLEPMPHMTVDPRLKKTERYLVHKAAEVAWAIAGQQVRTAAIQAGYHRPQVAVTDLVSDHSDTADPAALPQAICAK